MKKCLLILGIVSSAAISANEVQVKEVQYQGDLNYSRFCAAVVNDDLAMFKRALRSKVGTLAPSQKLLLEKIVSEQGVKCNGFDLVRFSMQRQATQLHAYLRELN